MNPDGPATEPVLITTTVYCLQHRSGTVHQRLCSVASLETRVGDVTMWSWEVHFILRTSGQYMGSFLPQQEHMYLGVKKVGTGVMPHCHLENPAYVPYNSGPH